MNILASISGGRSSHLMAWILKNDPKYANDKIIFAFANTGLEREETLVFVDRCDRDWHLGVTYVEANVHVGTRKACTHKVVTFENASRNGEPFELVIQKYGIPNSAFPHCTRELKLNPIHSYAATVFGGAPYVTAIGIRSDESSRIKISPDFMYPLVERGIRVKAVREFWKKMPFDLNLKDYEGNCTLCFKKSKRKILTIISEDPKAADWWRLMEQTYSNVPIENRTTNGPSFFSRKNVPMDDLIKESKLPFIPYGDPFWEKNRNNDMDNDQPCHCMLQELERDQQSSLL